MKKEIKATSKATENKIKRLPKAILCCFVNTHDFLPLARIVFLV
jgi:hypothetical protein